VVGGVIALCLLAGLTAAVLASQQRARDDAIERLEVRSRTSAQLLSSTIALSTTQLATQAQKKLSDPTPSEKTLSDWEAETKSRALYAILVDQDGRVIASRPSGTEPADHSAVQSALGGQTVLSAVQRVKSKRVIEFDVPFDVDGVGRRVLITATSVNLIAPLLASTLTDSAGTERGGALLLDRRGEPIGGTGAPASDPTTRRQLRQAIERHRSTGTAGEDHYAIQPMGTTGWQVALVAPESDLLASLPSFLWSRLALLAFALTLIMVVILAARAIASSRRIEEAREAAIKANDEKSRFLSHISHELKQPLAAIMGFSDILLRQTDLSEADRTHFAGVISRSGRTLEQLVSELLDISRIESGRVLLNLEATDVRMAVQDAFELNEPLAAVQHVTLAANSEAAEYLRPVADPMRLRQVLINLISNAVKYNRDGGKATVSIATTDRSTLRIAVSDEGEGISPDDIDKLFRPFERLGQQKSRRSAGTGLGLVISKGLVEAMGGSLRVESKVSAGSTFSFELALANDVAAATAPDRDEAIRDARATLDASLTGHVLYVEDEPANIELVARVIGRDRPGLDLETAMTGDDGVRAFTTRRPDLLLLDLNLPDMSGEQILRHLRSDPNTADVPVIVMSADASSLSITRLLQTGADAYITKPIDLDRFLGAIDILLSRSAKPGGRPPEAASSATSPV
jgi:signal transduction histidine kinase/ActR/RegA family two-component response regulator